jgi:hypothetical protein
MKELSEFRARLNDTYNALSKEDHEDLKDQSLMMKGSVGIIDGVLEMFEGVWVNHVLSVKLVEKLEEFKASR